MFPRFASTSIWFTILLALISNSVSINLDDKSDQPFEVVAPSLPAVFHDDDKRGVSYANIYDHDVSVHEDNSYHSSKSRHLEISLEMQAMMNLINSERRKRSLSELCFNANLNEAALDHSNDMRKNQYFSHTGYDGSQFFNRIKRTGYAFHGGAENLATDWSIESAHLGLMNSQGLLITFSSFFVDRYLACLLHF